MEDRTEREQYKHDEALLLLINDSDQNILVSCVLKGEESESIQ